MGHSKLGKQWTAVSSWSALISTMYAQAALVTLLFFKCPKVSPVIVVLGIHPPQTTELHLGEKLHLKNLMPQYKAHALVHSKVQYMYMHIHYSCTNQCTYSTKQGAHTMYMYTYTCTCTCTMYMYMQRRQGKDSPKADSEINTELPWMGFEPATTGLLIQCSAN